MWTHVLYQVVLPRDPRAVVGLVIGSTTTNTGLENDLQREPLTLDLNPTSYLQHEILFEQNACLINLIRLGKKSCGCGACDHDHERQYVVELDPSFNGL